jgi:hypothetical protein
MISATSQLTRLTTRRDLWCGALIGLVPLGLMVAIVALTLALTGMVRAITIGQSLAAEKTGTVTTLTMGIVIALVTALVALVRVWRRLRAWQRAGQGAQASGALWALFLTALVVVMPVLLALVLPQHPAP